MRVRNWHAPPFVACLLAMLALVAFIAVPAFSDSAGPPGVTTNDTQFALPSATDPGQSVTFADIAFGTGTITATANVAVEPINSMALAIVANGNVNDHAPPTGSTAVAQNAIVTPLTLAETYQEAHGDAILHGFAG